MKNYKLAIAGIAVAILAGEQVTKASLANTGANVVGGIDQNWTVSYDSTVAGPAYLATPNNAFPFGSPYWTPDNSTSSWITYSTPLNNTAQPGDSYIYLDTFTLTSSVTLTVRWLSDNESSLYLDSGVGLATKTLFGSIPVGNTSPLNTWSQYYSIFLGPGTYALEGDVINDAPLDGGPNPTGFRLEETTVPVPEPATVFAGMLLLLPFSVGAIRSLRKDRTA